MFLTVVVEDNDVFRASLCEVMETSFPGVSVRAARDAEEALDLLRERPADLVITDLSLPGLNGFDLTRRVKAMHGRTFVVIFTSHDLLEYRKAALDCGADRFLVKGGVSRQEFVAEIAGLIAAPAAASPGVAAGS